MSKNHLKFPFIQEYKSLSEIFMDQKLARLGDSFVNFIFSLALSMRKGAPVGVKVKGGMLAEAFKKAGLRKFLPSRIDRHKQADAAEALLVYAWIKGVYSIFESVKILAENENEIEGLKKLLLLAEEKMPFK